MHTVEVGHDEVADAADTQVGEHEIGSLEAMSMGGRHVMQRDKYLQ